MWLNPQNQLSQLQSKLAWDFKGFLPNRSQMAVHFKMYLFKNLSKLFLRLTGMLLGGYAIMLIRGPQQNQPTHPNKTVVVFLIFGDKQAETLIFPFTPILSQNLDTSLSQNASCPYWSARSPQGRALKHRICLRKRQHVAFALQALRGYFT